jgi:hypothetical protein
MKKRSREGIQPGQSHDLEPAVLKSFVPALRDGGDGADAVPRVTLRSNLGYYRPFPTGGSRPAGLHKQQKETFPAAKRVHAISLGIQLTASHPMQAYDPLPRTGNAVRRLASRLLFFIAQ